MRTRIKICGIKKQADFDYAVALGVDAIGLVFYQSSPRNVDLSQAQALVASPRMFVQVVALFMNATHDFVENIVNQFRVDWLQFHGSESPEFCKSFGLPYIKSVPMADIDSAGKVIQAHQLSADILLFDGHRDGEAGGSGTSFDWSQLPIVHTPIILAGGLTPENVGQAITQCHPEGVDVSSGVESDIGIKDRLLMKSFVQAVRRADSLLTNQDAASQSRN